MTSDVIKALAGTGSGTGAHLGDMIEALPAAIYITDAEGRITYFNAAAATLSGRVPELGVDQWCVTWRLFLPDGTPLPHKECPMAVALQGGEIATGTECVAERPDGTRFWFEPYCAVLRDADGHITGGINLLVDITVRKQAQIEAEAAALSLSAIVDSSDDAIIGKDLNGTVTSWNKSAERLFGYSAEEIVGKSVTLLIPPDRAEEEPQILARLRNGERVDHFETLRRRKDGTLVDISLTISPVKNARGEIIGASKIARDTTETKRADRGNRLLSAIVDSSDDAIISKDLNGVITSWNNGAERLFGYTAAETIGKPITMLIPEERLEEEPKILERLRRGQRVDHFETVRRKKDGSLIDISLTISPVRDADGAVIGASKIARDITERKRADAEIRRVNQDLEQFAFSASHDLQEPLRNVKIYSELLTRRYGDKFEGEALEFLGYLRAGATRMEMLMRDLLAYAQVTSMQEIPEKADANEALAQAREGLASAISEAGAQVTADLLPSVRAHHAHLQQLFQNLIGNAIKYRSHEPPRVRVTATRQPGSWMFAVADNGIGIAPEYREHVFGLFKRLHTSDEYSGTGIGLAICKRIVEQHHGRIWVESGPGHGSTFRFTLPD
ncbi:MAG TPA: PAS domain S-box protein [Candidatus Acidoferrales bacterium]|jgi:PAS domain S-box-containing protein|nr:PAS domain S-box protein [Candidatus Acidoferrales bacterium]